MKRSAIIFLILLFSIISIIGYGNSLPELSHKSTTQTFNRSGEFIWQLIFDFNNYPKWRENVYAVKKTPNTSQYAAWKEINEDGVTTAFQLVKFNQNAFITMEETGKVAHNLDAQNLGKWHFEITSSEDGKSSTLTISEDRLIPGIIQRILIHLLATNTDHIDSYFRSINNKITGDIIRAQKIKKRLPMKKQPSL